MSDVGIALLLSEKIQNAWEDYQTKVERNELEENDILRYFEDDRVE